MADNQNAEPRHPPARASDARARTESVQQLPEAAFPVLLALSLAHGLNDIIQAMLPSIYPLLKSSHGLNFTQIGLITFVFQVTASLLQPLIGSYTDRQPLPYSLAAGMSATLCGLVMLAVATTFPLILVSSAMIGVGSATFHPEASRLARMAAGGKHGFAQAVFQVGGNFGSSLGPLAASWIVMPRGQIHILWFTIIAAIGIGVLAAIGKWYCNHLADLRRNKTVRTPVPQPLSNARTTAALAVLGTLMFSKFFYLASLTNYYTFYLIEKFQISAEIAQQYLFVLLFAFAVGTVIGGPVGDRWGRKIVIWFSILGTAPFALLMPHATLPWTVVLTAFAGVILASGFSAILVYAHELLPEKVGMVSGIFFGSAFGLAGIGAALLGWLADYAGIAYVFNVCAYLPLLGLLTVFLPDLKRVKRG